MNKKATRLDRNYMTHIDVRSAVANMDITSIKPQYTQNSFEFKGVDMEEKGNDTWECTWCWWTGDSEELNALSGWTKKEVEEHTGLPFEKRPAPFHECPNCGEPTPMKI